MQTKIQWTEETWNPIVGCSKVSPGCKHCYAIREAHRMAGNPNPKISSVYSGLTKSNGGLNWTGVVRFVDARLTEPLHWKRPRRVFVNSMSDLFHEDISFETIDKIFAVMALCPQHTFQILTKRAERMLEYCNTHIPIIHKRDKGIIFKFNDKEFFVEWPLPNVWLGVSCEDQEAAEKRITLLLQTLAAIRWMSGEPLLGEIDLRKNAWIPWIPHSARPSHKPNPNKYLDWVVVGGESGPDARPMKPEWARSLRDQCVAAGVPFFFKQWGRYAPRTHQEANNDFENGSVWVGKNGEIEYATFLLGDLCTWDYERKGFTLMGDVGKKAAGRILDGREWNEYPRKEFKARNANTPKSDQE